MKTCINSVIWSCLIFHSHSGLVRGHKRWKLVKIMHAQKTVPMSNYFVEFTLTSVFVQMEQVGAQSVANRD